jgi:hypothetical protein
MCNEKKLKEQAAREAAEAVFKEVLGQGQECEICGAAHVQTLCDCYKGCLAMQRLIGAYQAVLIERDTLLELARRPVVVVDTTGPPAQFEALRKLFTEKDYDLIGQMATPGETEDALREIGPDYDRIRLWPVDPPPAGVIVFDDDAPWTVEQLRVIEARVKTAMNRAKLRQHQPDKGKEGQRRQA